MSWSSFLSDQKKRFTNVKDVFVSIAKGEGTTANVKNQTVKSALEGATKNPLRVAGVALAGASVAFAGKKIVQTVIAKKAQSNIVKQVPSIISKSKSVSKSAPKGTFTLDKIQKAAGIIGGTKSIIGNRSQLTTVNPSISASNPVIQAQSGLTASEALIYEGSGALPTEILGQSIVNGVTDVPLMMSNSLSSSTRSTTITRSSRRKGSRKKAGKRKSSRRSKKGSKKRSSKKRYGTAKQYKRKGGKSVKYTKNGQPYIILANGRARFVKGRRKK